MMRSKRLRIFLISRFCSAVADQILLFLIPLLVYRETHSLAYSGLALFVEWLPRVLSLPVAGVLADRFGGWRVYGVADGVRAGACGLLFFALPYVHSVFFVLIMCLSALCAICYAQAFISLEATVPLLVTHEEMPTAQNVLQGIDQAAMIVGPLVGALGVLHFAPTILLLWTSILFLVSFGGIRQLHVVVKQAYHSVRDSATSHPLRDLQVASRIVLGQPMLCALIVLSMAVNLLVGLSLATSAGLTVGAFAQSAHTYAVLQMMVGCSAVLLFPITPFLLKRWGLFTVGMAAYVGIVAGSFLLASHSFLGFALGCIVCASLCTPFNVYIRSERIKRIAPQHYGKTIGMIVLCNQSSIPLAGLIVSCTANSFDIRWVFVGAALGAALLGIYIFVKLHKQQVSVLDNNGILVNP